MHFAPTITEPNRSLTQLMILSMSTFLLGMFFGRDLPTGVELISLQTGLIGLMAFLGLTNLKPSVVVKHATEDTSIAPSNNVERRLDRHVPAAHFNRARRNRSISRNVGRVSSK